MLFMLFSSPGWLRLRSRLSKDEGAFSPSATGAIGGFPAAFPPAGAPRSSLLRGARFSAASSASTSSRCWLVMVGKAPAPGGASPSLETTQAFQSVILRIRNPSAPPTSWISTISEPRIASSTTAGSGVIMRMRLNPAIVGNGIHPSASIFERRKTSFTRFSTEK